MKNKAPVSVIIPCFRSAETVERAFNSVMSQTILPSQVILVDDCSDDNTADILYKLKGMHPDIVDLLIKKINGGAASARNDGWVIAREPYIAFLDSDDTWHPEKINIQYGYMAENPSIYLSGHMASLYDSKLILDLPLRIKLECLPVNPLRFLFKNPFSATSVVMVNRELPFRFKEGMRYAEDLNLWQSAAFSGIGVCRIEAVLSYKYKAHYGEGGLSSNLWLMELGELMNLKQLHANGSIGLGITIIALFFSLLKFVKRVFLTKLINISSILR